jgi:hypothetical protein
MKTKNIATLLVFALCYLTEARPTWTWSESTSVGKTEATGSTGSIRTGGTGQSIGTSGAPGILGVTGGYRK